MFQFMNYDNETVFSLKIVNDTAKY